MPALLIFFFTAVLGNAHGLTHVETLRKLSSCIWKGRILSVSSTTSSPWVEVPMLVVLSFLTVVLTQAQRHARQGTAELKGAKERSWLLSRLLTSHRTFLFSTSSRYVVSLEPGFTDNLDPGEQALARSHSLRGCFEKTFHLPGKHLSWPSGFI